MKNVKIFITTLIFCLVSSCGFINDAPVEDQNVFTSNELSSSCKLDPDQFGDILGADIEEQIKCLEENFNQFSRYVRSGDRDTISEGELTNFVRRFFKTNSDTIIQGLKLIFELNMLLLKDEADSINRDNITPLFRLLLTVNKQAIIVTNALKEMQDERDGQKIFEKRKELKKALQDFTDTSLAIIRRPGHTPKSIKLKEFLLGLNDRIDLGKNPIDEKLADAILFLKKVFLGGDKNILTSVEIEYAIQKIPKLVVMATDLTFINDKHFKNGKVFLGFRQNILKRFSQIITPCDDDEVLFKIEDLFVLFDRVSSDDDDFDFRDYETVFKSVKKDLIGGDDNYFNHKEFQHLLTYINISLEGLKFNESHKELTKEIDLLTLEEKKVRKSLFLEEVKTRVERIKKILNHHGGLPSKINILNFTKTLSSEIDGFDFDQDYLDAVFGVKILLAGGTKSQLSEVEFSNVLDKAHSLASFYFDLTYLNTSYQQDSSAKWSFLEEVVSQVIPTLENDDSLESISMNDLKIILTELFSPEAIESIEESIKELGGVNLESAEIEAIIKTLKEEIFESTPEVITIGEIKSLLSITQLSMGALELLQSYEEKSALAESNPSLTNQLSDELEYKASIFNNKAQSLLSKIKYIKTDLDYSKIIDALAPVLVDESPDDERDIPLSEYIENFKPLKTILLGGTRNVLTFDEISTVLRKLPNYVSAFFSFSYTNLDKEVDSERQWNLYLKTFNRIKPNFVINSSLDYFDGYELMNSVDWFMNLNLEKGQEPINYKKFAETVLKFKGRVLHSIKDPKVDPLDNPIVKDFKFNHIHRILEWTHEALENLYYTERTYKHYKKTLSKKTPISYLNLYSFSDYPGVRPGSLAKLRREFLYITRNHRHFTKEIERTTPTGEKLTKFIQYFGKDIVRDQYGFVQLSIIRLALQKAMLGYSIKVNGQDAVDVDRINMLLLDFKPVLEEFNLWTKDITTFGENTILLGDLFQNSSNGDNAINVDEGAEYASMVIVAVTLGDEIMKDIATVDKCENQGTDDDILIMPRCYRQYFFDSWLNQLEYSLYFPKLTRYYKNERRFDVIDFVRKTEGFARDEDDEDVAMGIRDYTLLVGALLNIESTFVRFDLNNDNIIDTNELHKAFVIYESSIIKIAELNGWKKVFSKTVFFYMVKNKKIPTESQVMKYHFNLHFNPMYKENIRAKRLNIGALLYNLIQYRSGTN
jgi:hypothetical protein